MTACRISDLKHMSKASFPETMEMAGAYQSAGQEVVEYRGLENRNSRPWDVWYEGM